MLGMPNVRGQLGRFDLRIAASGDSGAALMESLDVRLDVVKRKTDLRQRGGRTSRAVLFG